MRLGLMVLVATLAARADAQVRVEGRVEGTRSGSATAVAAGVGVALPVGPYVRSGVVLAQDFWAGNGQARRARIESQVRFLLDPVAEQRWGLSVGGGLGYRERAYLMFLADLEGPAARGVRAAFQVALGGGARVAVVIRRASRGRR